MGKRITGNFDQDEVRGFLELKADQNVEHTSEAVRIASRAGLQKLGYVDGTKQDTTLRKTARRFADSFTLLGVFWLGLTFVYPLELRALAIPIFLVALAMYLMDRALGSCEPAVSRRLIGLFRLVGLFRGDTA